MNGPETVSLQAGIKPGQHPKAAYHKRIHFAFGRSAAHPEPGGDAYTWRRLLWAAGLWPKAV
jgi:hypothetical protein